MGTESVDRLVKESDRELERSVRMEAPLADAARVLADLLSAFDTRHRRREAFTLRENARVLASRSTA